jgi:hypothetical protein
MALVRHPAVAANGSSPLISVARAQTSLFADRSNGRQVLECASPLALSASRWAPKRRRAAALQDAVAFATTLLPLLTLITSLTLSPAHAAPEATITADASRTIQPMRGGFGASWHAIEEPMPVVGDHSHGGSAWAAPRLDFDLGAALGHSPRGD